MRSWPGLLLSIVGIVFTSGCRSESFPFPYGIDLKMSRIDASTPASDLAAPPAVDLSVSRPDLFSKAERCRELGVLGGVVIAQNRACASDVDCLLVKTRCGLPGYCGEYVNTTARDALTAIVIEWDQLGCGDAIDCAPCPPQGAPAACRGGICQARR